MLSEETLVIFSFSSLLIEINYSDLFNGY
jgi:hypothetical protein